MAEKKELTQEEKVELAKELFTRGSRNYLVKEYSESADDLSRACEMFAEIYGNYADELAMPYLLYAKALIAISQEAGDKLLVAPEGEEEDDDEDEDDVDDSDQIENKDAKEDDVKEVKEEKDSDESQKKEQAKSEDNEKEASEMEVDKNDETPQAGPSQSTDQKDANGTKEIDEIPQAGPSKLSDVPKLDVKDDAKTEGIRSDESETENLQIAWEILEMAAKIFERQGKEQLENLADTYFELAEISLENSNFEASVKDYSESIFVRFISSLNLGISFNFIF